MLSAFWIAVLGFIGFWLFGRSFAATIFVPDVYSEHVQLGLIDGSDPNTSVDNKPFNDLRASGVLDFNPAGLGRLQDGGDTINVPSIGEPADFERVDHTSDTDLTPADYSTNTDLAIVQYNKKVYQFKASDKIRSGKDASIEYSRKMGGKIAKRLFDVLMKTTIGALDAVDTPSANCHVLDVFSGTQGSEKYPTVEYLRQAKLLLGDAGMRLNTAVMNSTSFGWLLKDLLTNYGAGSIIGDQAARTGLLGQLLGIQNWVVSDLVPTTDGGSDQDKYNILLFGPGALWAGYQSEPEVEVDTDILKPSSRKFLAVNFASVAHLRFVKTALTSNPTDVQLIAAASWDEAYDDHRRVLAVKLVTNGVAEAS